MFLWLLTLKVPSRPKKLGSSCWRYWSYLIHVYTCLCSFMSLSELWDRKIILSQSSESASRVPEHTDSRNQAAHQISLEILALSKLVVWTRLFKILKRTEALTSTAKNTIQNTTDNWHTNTYHSHLVITQAFQQMEEGKKDQGKTELANNFGAINLI